MTFEVRDYDEVRAELNAAWLERGPLCPADLDPDAWAAVSANYDGDSDWAPGPEYHAEYRDARAAVQAMVSKVAGVLREMDQQQCRTDDDGGREVAWHHWRDAVEDALGLTRGALACELDFFETVQERDERSERERDRT